jgi:hypothetical protein
VSQQCGLGSAGQFFCWAQLVLLGVSAQLAGSASGNWLAVARVSVPPYLSATQGHSHSDLRVPRVKEWKLQGHLRSHMWWYCFKQDQVCLGWCGCREKHLQREHIPCSLDTTLCQSLMNFMGSRQSCPHEPCYGLNEFVHPKMVRPNVTVLRDRL